MRTIRTEGHEVSRAEAVRVILLCLLFLCSSAQAYDLKTLLVLPKADNQKDAEAHVRQQIWYGCQLYGTFIYQISLMRDDSQPREAITANNFYDPNRYTTIWSTLDVKEVWELKTHAEDLRDAAVAVCIEADGVTNRFRTLTQFLNPQLKKRK